MKRLFALTALASAAMANAQQADETRIQAAFEKMRAMPMVYVLIEGTETTNNVTNTFTTKIWWQQLAGGKPTNRFQMLQEQDGYVVQRVVGNGETLWNYDLRAREYSSTSYGGYGNARPTNYVRDLLNFANQSARGQAAWGTRFLREVYGGDNAIYRSWMPGVTPTNLPDITPTPDPVLDSRSYVGTPSTDFIMYSSAPRRSVVFELRDDPPSDTYALASIYFAERNRVGTRDRVVQWKMSWYEGLAFGDSDFAPYNQASIQGWRPVVGPQAVTNGN